MELSTNRKPTKPQIDKIFRWATIQVLILGDTSEHYAFRLALKFKRYLLFSPFMNLSNFIFCTRNKKPRITFLATLLT